MLARSVRGWLTALRNVALIRRLPLASAARRLCCARLGRTLLVGTLSVGVLLGGVSGCGEVIGLGDEYSFKRLPTSEIELPSGCSASRWIRDDFDNGDFRPEIWGTVGNSGAQISFEDGQAELVLDADIMASIRLNSRLPIDVTNKRLEMELKQAPTVVNGATFSILLLNPPLPHTFGFSLEIGNGVISSLAWTGGEMFVASLNIPYSTSKHRWLALEHNGEEFRIEASADGVSWNLLAKDNLSDIPFEFDDMLLSIGVGSASQPPAGQSTTVVFDNVRGTLCLPSAE